MKYNLDSLVKKEIEFEEELNKQQNQIDKTKRDALEISKQILELKNKQKHGSIKFVHANFPMILKKVAPKHKLAPPREIVLSSGTDVPMTAKIPWADEKCTDENPCNINLCPRCTLIYFQKVLDGILADYYTGGVSNE